VIKCEPRLEYIKWFVASQCFISGDDLMSAGDGALQTRPGTDFFQRNCQDILGEPVIFFVHCKTKNFADFSVSNLHEWISKQMLSNFFSWQNC